MDNVGIVVDDLPVTTAFFRELGLELGSVAIAVVKATTVIVETPGVRA